VDVHPEEKAAIEAEARKAKQVLDRYIDAKTKDTKTAIERVQDKVDAIEAQAQKAALSPNYGSSQGDGAVQHGKGPLLNPEQKIAGHFNDSSNGDYRADNVRLGALLAAFTNYDKVKDSLNDDECKVFSSILDPSGGLLIPTAIGAMFLDAVRPKTQVFNAGALTYPMEAGHVLLPGWNVAPKAGWRGPNGSFVDGGGTFREINLNAQDVGAYADIPQQLMEDAGKNLDSVSNIIEDQLSKAIAQAIDLAALLSQDALSGPGTHVPTGLANVASDGTVTANYGIAQPNTMGTNGGQLASWDPFIDAASTVYGNNFSPNANLIAPRTAASLGKLKLTTNDYLSRPAYLDGIRDLQTGQIGSAYKKGTSSDTSVGFTGDFSQMVVGMRGGLGVLRDPYTQALGRTTRIIVWMRADVAVLNAQAFSILDGIRP